MALPFSVKFRVVLVLEELDRRPARLHTAERIVERRRAEIDAAVEQNVALSLKLATRAYVLENSRIVMQGTGAELLNDDRVRRAYLGIAPAADGAAHHGG